eukprot:GHRR01005075.1.p1 GENE.GHRR01005075.1~~GHRR01005075.1.p1  ORF type:complete len:775 (+),score=250.97 GHRR01005075.1:386-2710(+)
MSAVSCQRAGSVGVARSANSKTSRPSLDYAAASSIQGPATDQTYRFCPRAAAANGWKHQKVPTCRQNQRHRCRAVKSTNAANKVSDGTLQPGLLISYKKDDKHILGYVVEPDGKKNWWIIDQHARRFSLPAKTVSLVLPGSNYVLDDVQRFTAAAEAADMSLLDIAWAVAAEDSRSYSLPELSKLLFADELALSQYMTFWMLLQDSIYFKTTFKAGVWSIAPKTVDQVEAAQAAAATEAAATADRTSFLEAFAAATAAASKQRPASLAALLAEWQQGPHAERVSALMEFAQSAPGKCSAASCTLARECLLLLKRRPEPDVALMELINAGLLRLHEPVPLLRSGRTTDTEMEPHIEAAAQALLSTPPSDPDASLRQDLTHLRVFTVDDASTTEIDDGLSVQEDEAGRQLLWVHVADPTRWITPGDVLDLEARARSRSLYFPWGSLPMFPTSLAEGPFSLNSSSSSQGSSSDNLQPCCAFSVCVSLAEDGSLGELITITPSKIRDTYRLTYDEADLDLSLGPGMCRYEDLQLIYEAARLRRSWRVSHGCIDIDLPEGKLEVSVGDLDRKLPGITCTKLSQWESAARLMVAEMMILAGEAVGSLGASAGLPLPYRGQEAPQLPSQKILDALPEGPCRGFALRRCMTRSVIEGSPVRHASLALDAYVQFTSPIRRYSDIMAHFNIKAHLRGEPLPFPATSIMSISAAAVESNRELGRAESDVAKYWAAEYLRQHSSSSWTGVVLGWFRAEAQLAAVTLDELGLETIVKVQLPVTWQVV